MNSITPHRAAAHLSHKERLRPPIKLVLLPLLEGEVERSEGEGLRSSNRNGYFA